MIHNYALSLHHDIIWDTLVFSSSQRLNCCLCSHSALTHCTYDCSTQQIWALSRGLLRFTIRTSATVLHQAGLEPAKPKAVDLQSTLVAAWVLMQKCTIISYTRPSDFQDSNRLAISIWYNRFISGIKDSNLCFYFY